MGTYVGNTCIPEVDAEKERPLTMPEKYDVAGDSAEQTLNPTTNTLAPKEEPTSDLDEIIDVDWEDNAEGACTDDEPR